uniref:Uncharacterized protein n=1 Tax=Triticum urartu TaxID=4572 RepID=A0A8R7UB21_TRIUA
MGLASAASLLTNGLGLARSESRESTTSRFFLPPATTAHTDAAEREIGGGSPGRDRPEREEEDDTRRALRQLRGKHPHREVPWRPGGGAAALALLPRQARRREPQGGQVRGAPRRLPQVHCVQESGVTRVATQNEVLTRDTSH